LSKGSVFPGEIERAGKARKQVGRQVGSGKKYCTVVTFDIKNAFNTADWKCIFKTLTKMRVPLYLLNILVGYFTQRILKYDTGNVI
jgi:hypothetical protein